MRLYDHLHCLNAFNSLAQGTSVCQQPCFFFCVHLVSDWLAGLASWLFGVCLFVLVTVCPILAFSTHQPTNQPTSQLNAIATSVCDVCMGLVMLESESKQK